MSIESERDREEERESERKREEGRERDLSSCPGRDEGDAETTSQSKGQDGPTPMCISHLH